MNKKQTAASLLALTVFCTGLVGCGANKTSDVLSAAESAESSVASVSESVVESAVESAVEASSVEEAPAVDLEALAPYVGTWYTEPDEKGESNFLTLFDDGTAEYYGLFGAIGQGAWTESQLDVVAFDPEADPLSLAIEWADENTMNLSADGEVVLTLTRGDTLEAGKARELAEADGYIAGDVIEVSKEVFESIDAEESVETDAEAPADEAPAEEAPAEEAPAEEAPQN